MSQHRILDKEFTNYVHFAGCFVVSHIAGKRLTKGDCVKCPITGCSYRHEASTELAMSKANLRTQEKKDK